MKDVFYDGKEKRLILLLSLIYRISCYYFLIDLRIYTQSLRMCQHIDSGSLIKL